MQFSLNFRRNENGVKIFFFLEMLIYIANNNVLTGKLSFERGYFLFFLISFRKAVAILNLRKKKTHEFDARKNIFFSKGRY